MRDVVLKMDGYGYYPDEINLLVPDSVDLSEEAKLYWEWLHLSFLNGIKWVPRVWKNGRRRCEERVDTVKEINFVDWLTTRCGVYVVKDTRDIFSFKAAVANECYENKRVPWDGFGYHYVRKVTSNQDIILVP